MPKPKKSLTPTEQARLLDDIRRHSGDVWVAQFRQWVSFAVNHAREVATGAAAPSKVALFWISVYGVLVDIRDKLEQRVRFLGSVGPLPAVAATNLNAARKLLAAITALSNLLDTDELCYLAYRRHVECHPFQDAFRFRRAKDGSLIAATSILGQQKPTEDVNASITSVLRKHQLDERAIAVSFAQRMLPALESVKSATDKFLR